jgi:hypothetical protein
LPGYNKRENQPTIPLDFTDEFTHVSSLFLFVDDLWMFSYRFDAALGGGLVELLGGSVTQDPVGERC